MSRRTRFACALLLLTSLPLAAAPAPTAPAAPPHAGFLPPDDAGLRSEQPDQQVLLQVVDFSVTLGNQRQSSQQPIPITTPTLVKLRAKPVSKAAKAGELSTVLIHFEADGKSLKKAAYDATSRTLTLNYPLSRYRPVLDLLRNGGPIYCQFLSYPNGHVWADLHLGPVRVR
ncbi:hypothetical protein [Metapseudomonas otitidis]|uniref:hypothetical protein n=1 Tax=Metapseudomonas otitidis TaxID=319939 RepID=UPI0013F6462D|nr:hypothetical protein [Pseudomonas otitidis]